MSAIPGSPGTAHAFLNVFSIVLSSASLLSVALTSSTPGRSDDAHANHGSKKYRDQGPNKFRTICTRSPPPRKKLAQNASRQPARLTAVELSTCKRGHPYRTIFAAAPPVSPPRWRSRDQIQAWDALAGSRQAQAEGPRDCRAWFTALHLFWTRATSTIHSKRDHAPPTPSQPPSYSPPSTTLGRSALLHTIYRGDG